MARRERVVEAFVGHDGKGYFRVRGANGKVLKGTESPHGYANRSSARRAAAAMYPGLTIVSV